MDGSLFFLTLFFVWFWYHLARLSGHETDLFQLEREQNNARYKILKRRNRIAFSLALVF